MNGQTLTEVELLSFPPSPAEANPRVRHVLDEIARLAPGRVVIVGGWDKFLARQLQASFSGQYQIHVNDSCSLGWLRRTVEEIRSGGQKAILMSNFPRDSSRLGVCPESEQATGVAIFFWGTYAPGYYESVFHGLSKGGRIQLAQLLVDPAGDSDLLSKERRQLTACTDKAQCQSLIRGILQSLEGDANCQVANYGGVLMP